MSTDDMAALRRTGLGWKTIGRRAGVRADSARRRVLRRHPELRGLCRGRMIHELRVAGRPYREIAAHFGFEDVTAVVQRAYRWRRQHGIALPADCPCAEKAPQTFWAWALVKGSREARRADAALGAAS